MDFSKCFTVLDENNSASSSETVTTAFSDNVEEQKIVSPKTDEQKIEPKETKKKKTIELTPLENKIYQILLKSGLDPVSSVRQVSTNDEAEQ